ncbi:MAG: response regulator [Verrucomicrobiia bacterium]
MRTAKRPELSKPRTRSSNRTPPTRPRKPTVLVVDDSPELREMMALVLKAKEDAG